MTASANVVVPVRSWRGFNNCPTSHPATSSRLHVRLTSNCAVPHPRPRFARVRFRHSSLSIFAFLIPLSYFFRLFCSYFYPPPQSHPARPRQWTRRVFVLMLRSFFVRHRTLGALFVNAAERRRWQGMGLDCVAVQRSSEIGRKSVGGPKIYLGDPVAPEAPAANPPTVAL